MNKWNMYLRNGIAMNLDNEIILFRERMYVEPSETDVSHTVKNNENLWNIAYKYWKDTIDSPEQYYWVIADYNGISTPYDISAYTGLDILIPDITRYLSELDKLQSKRNLIYKAGSIIQDRAYYNDIIQDI